MCGRFALDTSIETILEQFKVDSSEDIPISYNLAPTENALCLVSNEAKVTAVQMRWGIVPWYSRRMVTKKPSVLINARAETIFEKPAFRQSVSKRRCVLIMSGFFEWQHHAKTKEKQPYFIEERHHCLLSIAAIWEGNALEPGAIPSFCLLTTKATNPTVLNLHDRMPWMLSPQQRMAWLAEEELSSKQLIEILKMDESVDLISYPVTQAMNSALYKGKDSIEPKIN